MGKKHKFLQCCLQETHFSFKAKHKLKVKGWKKIFMQMETKESRSGYTYIRSNRLSVKIHHKRQTTSLTIKIKG